MVVQAISARPSLLRDANCADDQVFDSIYPAAIRALSRRFWTPVDVARRAAGLLREAGVRRVLDVGSGVGKFVLAAAAAAPELHFVGIEQRKRLVEMARRARSRLRVPNARFRVGDATLAPWRAFDAFYFFNPFAENVFAGEDCIDCGVELTESRFVRDVLRTDHALRNAPNGTIAVTYHGNSGRIPAGYDLLHSERAGSDWLQLWVKRRDADRSLFAVEPNDFGAGSLSRCRGLACTSESRGAHEEDGRSLDARGGRR